jgi:NarL family two-component system response regulator LiaR
VEGVVHVVRGHDPVRVAIANDYPVVVRGLAAIVEAHDDRFQLVEASVGDATQSSADVLLYDDFASTKELGEFISGVQAKVVVFSSNIGWTSVQAALGAGCAGYLFKGVSEEDLLSALERVHQGTRVVELGADALPAKPTGSWPGREHGLTPRESEILALICRGLTNAEIAGTLYLSVNSIKTYVRTLYRKIDVQRRSQAVRFGIGHGFLHPGAMSERAPQRTSPSPGQAGAEAHRGAGGD